jgi:DNA replication protein DnaC
MAFSAEVIHRATLRLEQAKADKDSQTRQKLGEVYSRLPRVQKIDGMLRQSMALAAQAVFTQGGDARQAMEQVRQANLLLQAERQSLIDEEFGPNFIDESPICSRCGGMGYVGTAMCSCLQELCRQEQKKELSLLACGAADFEDFVVEYYPAAVDSRYGASPRAIMERNLKLCKK